MFRGLVKLFLFLLVVAIIIAPLVLGAWAGIACYGAVYAALHGGFVAWLVGAVAGLSVFSAAVSVLYWVVGILCAAIFGTGVFALLAVLGGGKRPK